jgi:hypothetical protein
MLLSIYCSVNWVFVIIQIEVYHLLRELSFDLKRKKYKQNACNHLNEDFPI